MYTEYIANFDNALKTLEESCKKNRAFEELVREFEVCTENKSMSFILNLHFAIRVSQSVETCRSVVTCWRLSREYLDTNFFYKVSEYALQACIN